MLEFLTGTGLAAAAGLNAYVPLLVLGLAARFTDLVELPSGWAWLENEWVLIVVGVLLLLELVSDKIPAVDSVNDWIQTIVRPAAGGIVFGSGATAETATVSDPAAFFSSSQWVPVAAGIGIALAVHLGKTLVRPLANAATAGIAAPVLSTVEDVLSVALSAAAILLPILVILVLAAGAIGAIALVRRMRVRRRAAATA